MAILKEVRRTVNCEGEMANVSILLEGSMDLCVANCLDKVELEICNEHCCCGCDEEFYEPTPKFGGAYYNMFGELVYIDKVIYNKAKRTVVVLWNDGTKTKSTCDVRDTWNAELGLTLAVMKKITGGQEFVQQLLSDWTFEVDAEVPQIKTLKEVRKKYKTK